MSTDLVLVPQPAAGRGFWRRAAGAALFGWMLGPWNCPALSAQAPLSFPAPWLGEAGPAGELCARGETYKMVFDAAGATYYPRLAAKAERHWPVRFCLRAASIGGREMPFTTGRAERSAATQVRIARGAFTEVWDLTADHAEQSFVLADSPGDGELRFEVACETELGVRPDADGALWFVRSDGSGVWCGQALVRDAAGRSLPLALSWQRGAMQLCVPAAFLASASWPLVVDPVVRTVAVTTSTNTLARPRAAFDPVAGVWLAVCEDLVTATDTDVLSFRLALDGSVLDSVALDLTPSNAISPDVAALGAHGQFLVGWIDETNDVLRWRRRLGNAAGYTPARSSAIGPQQAGSLLALGGAKAGDLGIACFTAGFGLVRQAAALTIDVNDNVSPLTPFGPTSGSFVALEVCDRADSGDDWGLVVQAGLVSEFYGLLAGPSVGTILASAPVTLPAGSSPRVAGFGPFWVTWLDGSTPARVHVMQISPFRGHTFLVDFTENLTTIENPPANVGRRSDLAFASDGCRFVYSFREDHTNSPTATVINTVRVRNSGSGVINRCVFDERRAGVARVGPNPSLCAAGATGGPAGAYLLLEIDSSSTLAAVRYDGREPGDMFTSVATQCGSPFAPLIGADGFAVLGGRFRVALARTVGAPLLLVSSPEPVPVPICAPNPACLLGVRLPAVLNIPGTLVDLDVPCDANLLGATLAFQGLDVGGPGGCPASVFGVDMRLTDTVLATVR